MNDIFMDKMKETLVNSSDNISITENGAVGFKTTGKALLDINFAVSSLRNKTDDQIESMYAAACGEDLTAAIVWLFFARDVRGGLGERRLFRVCMRYLAREFPDKVRKILPLISEYGRWDDLTELVDTSVSKDVMSIVKSQLGEDMKNMQKGASVSLLAKWLPSENASSQDTKQKACVIRKALAITPKTYRKMLSALRKHIDIIERKMSANEWDGISYEAVPSRANLIYNSAFLRHDEERRREYLGKLEKGETKINASTLFPHDVVHKYSVGGEMWSRGHKSLDQTVEALWKALPNTVSADSSTVVVADGSGSMTSPVDLNSSVTALEVADALAIYFAEHLSGPYHNKYITFSKRPQLVDLSGASTLLGKLYIADKHTECGNTNIEKVFDLILSTAVNNRLTQDQLPKNVLVISDMEFDSCAVSNGYHGYGYCRNRIENTLFSEITSRFAQYGYKLPRLVFWNVASRTGTIPVKENELGVALVSGFSPNVAKMVMSGKLDPLSALLETLSGERYRPIIEALNG